LQDTQKKSEICPSNQVPAAAMTSALDEERRPFNCFFQSGRAKDLSAPLKSQNMYAFFVNITMHRRYDLK